MKVKILYSKEYNFPKIRKETIGSAGFDLYAHSIVSVWNMVERKMVERKIGEETANWEKIAILSAPRITIFSCGFRLGLPKGYEAQIRSRSGLASKGIVVLNAPGTIDSDYRGEIKVILGNLFGFPVEIERGNRIAQMVIQKLPQVDLVEVDHLAGTQRGGLGFGSTGK